MTSLWLSLMAATVVIAPLSTASAATVTAAPVASSAVQEAHSVVGPMSLSTSASATVRMAQAGDDDDAHEDPVAASETSPMSPDAAPGNGMPASAMNGDQLGLPALSKSSQDVPSLRLGKDANDGDFAVNRKHFVLRAGQAYRWRISSAGNLEYKFHAPQFFRDIWFNQIVISDLELHMAGPPAWLEFDAEGTIQVQFNTIRPGNYTWFVEGLDGAQDMKGTITVVP